MNGGRCISWLLIGAFLFLLTGPTLDKIIPLDSAPQPKENRVLTHRPPLGDLQFGHLQKFLAGNEAWFNDHFGFRNQLVAWSHEWRHEIYHDGDSYYHMVTGPHQWQFYGEFQMVEHHLGWLKFTPQQLAAWQILLEKRRDWLAKQHIEYLFVIAPDKQTIYPDELPRWIQNAALAKPQTKLDQFVDYMKAHSTVHVLDLRQSLIAARKIAPMYLQHDTHWNLFGGFIACQEIIKSLRQIPNLPPLRLEDFDWTNQPFIGGDLAPDGNEQNYFEFQPRANLSTVKFLSLGDGHFSAVAENPALARTAVVFHDSFGLAWEKFLVYEFKRVVFVPNPSEFYSAFYAPVISSNKPDVVVNETVERFFNVLDPAGMMNRDALP